MSEAGDASSEVICPEGWRVDDWAPIEPDWSTCGLNSQTHNFLLKLELGITVFLTIVLLAMTKRQLFRCRCCTTEPRSLCLVLCNFTVLRTAFKPYALLLLLFIQINLLANSMLHLIGHMRIGADYHSVMWGAWMLCVCSLGFGLLLLRLGSFVHHAQGRPLSTPRHKQRSPSLEHASGRREPVRIPFLYKLILSSIAAIILILGAASYTIETKQGLMRCQSVINGVASCFAGALLFVTFRFYSSLIMLIKSDAVVAKRLTLFRNLTSVFWSSYAVYFVLLSVDPDYTSWVMVHSAKLGFCFTIATFVVLFSLGGTNSVPRSQRASRPTDVSSNQLSNRPPLEAKPDEEAGAFSLGSKDNNGSNGSHCSGSFHISAPVPMGLAGQAATSRSLPAARLAHRNVPRNEEFDRLRPAVVVHPDPKSGVFLSTLHRINSAGDSQSNPPTNGDA